MPFLWPALILPISQTAAILDLLPIFRRLPDTLLPIKKEGREIHKRELTLFRGHYLKAKQGLKDGTAKVPRTDIQIQF